MIAMSNADNGSAKDSIRNYTSFRDAGFDTVIKVPEHFSGSGYLQSDFMAHSTETDMLNYVGELFEIYEHLLEPAEASTLRAYIRNDDITSAKKAWDVKRTLKFAINDLFLKKNFL